jgi:uroporphyrinogen III methyltransferase/synthase
MADLAGRTVLITRTPDAAEPLVRLLQAEGAKTLLLPAIEITDPVSWEACDRAIVNLRMYDGIFFTSKNGVERFLRRIEAINPSAFEVLKRRPIYAVGEKTEEALETAGVSVTATPDVASAEDLAELFLREEVAGRRFLFPKSEIARDVLPNALRSMDAVVDEIVVYRTLPPRQLELDRIRIALAEQSIDVVTFYSPSAVRNFVQMMGSKCLDTTTIAVIGPATQSTARSLGLNVRIISKHATSESLVAAIKEYFVSERR